MAPSWQPHISMSFHVCPVPLPSEASYSGRLHRCRDRSGQAVKRPTSHSLSLILPWLYFVLAQETDFWKLLISWIVTSFLATRLRLYPTQTMAQKHNPNNCVLSKQMSVGSLDLHLPMMSWFLVFINAVHLSFGAKRSLGKEPNLSCWLIKDSNLGL